MPRIPRVDRTLSSTIPFARGVADRAFRVAGPAVTGVVGRVASHLPRRPGPAPSRPETFTPTPSVGDPAPETADAATEGGTDGATDGAADAGGTQPVASGVPTPATVARNVAGPRPTAKSPTKRKPRSVPGAKLPVTRPST